MRKASERVSQKTYELYTCVQIKQHTDGDGMSRLTQFYALRRFDIKMIGRFLE